MKDCLVSLAIACVSTAAFSFVYELPLKYIFAAALIGTAAWFGYIFTEPVRGYAMATLTASAIITLLARIASPVFRTPLSIFLVPALFLLVPGKDIFYSAYYLIGQRLYEALESFGRTVVVSGAIVFGIALVYVIPKKVFNIFKRKK